MSDSFRQQEEVFSGNSERSRSTSQGIPHHNEPESPTSVDELSLPASPEESPTRDIKSKGKESWFFAQPEQGTPKPSSSETPALAVGPGEESSENKAYVAGYNGTCLQLALLAFSSCTGICCTPKA